MMEDKFGKVIPLDEARRRREGRSPQKENDTDEQSVISSVELPQTGEVKFFKGKESHNLTELTIGLDRIEEILLLQNMKIGEDVRDLHDSEREQRRIKVMLEVTELRIQYLPYDFDEIVTHIEHNQDNIEKRMLFTRQRQIDRFIKYLTEYAQLAAETGGQYHYLEQVFRQEALHLVVLAEKLRAIHEKQFFKK